MTDLSKYPSPSVAVDLAILTVADDGLQVMLVKRDEGWAIPGGFVHLDTALDDTVARVLAEKTGIETAHFEQLATYGDPGRDPRGHVISIVYLALCPEDVLTRAARSRPDVEMARIVTDWDGETGGPARALDADGAALPLAFDHADILGDVVKRLRGKIDYSSVGFALLPKRFTLLAAQKVHEAILGKTLTKPAFRRKLLDRGLIQPTGAYEKGGANRPAELYQLKDEK
jgi:8-oxo-dGTP diphosphatase